MNGGYEGGDFSDEIIEQMYAEAGMDDIDDDPYSQELQRRTDNLLIKLQEANPDVDLASYGASLNEQWPIPGYDVLREEAWAMVADADDVQNDEQSAEKAKIKHASQITAAYDEEHQGLLLQALDMAYPPNVAQVRAMSGDEIRFHNLYLNGGSPEREASYASAAQAVKDELYDEVVRELESQYGAHDDTSAIVSVVFTAARIKASADWEFRNTHDTSVNIKLENFKRSQLTVEALLLYRLGEQGDKEAVVRALVDRASDRMMALLEEQNGPHKS